jgi:hypothetical protein
MPLIQIDIVAALCQFVRRGHASRAAAKYRYTPPEVGHFGCHSILFGLNRAINC